MAMRDNFKKAAKAERQKYAINKPDMYGANRFFAAIEEGREEDVLKMLEAGADVHFRTQAPGRITGALAYIPYATGSTPLHAACLYGRWSTVFSLMTKGADHNTKNTEGCTPLDYALRGYEQAKTDHERKEAGRFTFKSVKRDAQERKEDFESIVRHLVKKGAKTGLYELPKMFLETDDKPPPEAPKLP